MQSHLNFHTGMSGVYQVVMGTVDTFYYPTVGQEFPDNILSPHITA